MPFSNKLFVQNFYFANKAVPFSVRPKSSALRSYPKSWYPASSDNDRVSWDFFQCKSCQQLQCNFFLRCCSRHRTHRERRSTLPDPALASPDQNQFASPEELSHCGNDCRPASQRNRLVESSPAKGVSPSPQKMTSLYLFTGSPSTPR